MNTHRAIEDGLEDFLAGTVDREGRVRIEAHLKKCAECRQEVEAMREMSGLFATLRSPDPPVPAPGFYARVNQLIEKQQPAQACWRARWP
jgi:predicted anti-sigma-YlaC factor YlaD